jgi:hypothetical protein
MEELDYNHEIFNAQQAEQDKNLAVRFYKQALKDEAKSVEEGRAIFVDTIMVEIRVRGDRNNVVNRPVREDDKHRFRQAYQSYEKHLESGLLEGTPLGEWGAVGPSFVEEMRYLGFYTVEQLAEANDTVVGRVPGLQTFKQKAKVFLEFTKGAAPLERLQADLETEKNAREAAQIQVADLASRLADMEKKLAAATPAKAK